MVEASIAYLSGTTVDDDLQPPCRGGAGASGRVRGLARVGRSENAAAVRRLLTDDEAAVARAASSALTEMSRRL